MNYEKKYKESLERAKEQLNGAKAFDYDNEQIAHNIRTTVYNIFPELKESEDEKVIRDIKVVLECSATKFFKEEGKMPIWYDRAVAWLEKQDFNYTFEIKEGHWYKCVCDYMLNNSDVMFKYDRLYYCRRNWRLEGEIDEINVKDIGVNGYKSFFRPATNQEIKDWLEKQDESDEAKAKVFLINKGYPIDANGVFPTYEEMYNIIRAGLEQQSEQKHTDKVESKFKKGDWIVFNGLTLYINEVVKGYYRTISKGGIFNSYDWDIDNAARLWTLNEVRDGDVLKEDSCIFIVEKMNPNGTAIVHCCLFDDGEFDLTGSTLRFDVDSTRPATKEQHDTLFARIKEDGYKWSYEDRKLIKL